MFLRNSIFFLSIIALLFTSCVSKKKFLEMEAGRLKAEELSRKLEQENTDKAERIVALIADFEAMKNELLESNVKKDHYIDSISVEMFSLADKLNEVKLSSRQTSNSLEFEQKRLNDALANNEKTIQNLNNQVISLEETIAKQRTSIENKNFNLEKLVEQTQVLEGKIAAGEKKVNDLLADLQKVKNETTQLQKQIQEKDETILRLTNNVKLLRTELDAKK